ncbi:MAG: hypothetical protein NWF08_02240 [Candidatus Bathyarchaeota archaeon]|nr:hypothetical protein [Candidatus Bathyarchaeota archaeon]
MLRRLIILISNRIFGIMSIVLGLICLLASLIITLYHLSLHSLILFCSLFIAFFTIGFITLIIERSKSLLKIDTQKSRMPMSQVDYKKKDDKFDQNKNSNEKIAMIRDEVLETIKKLKEIELEE